MGFCSKNTRVGCHFPTASDFISINRHIYHWVFGFLFCFCFCFDSTSSFFPKLFLPSSPVIYWAPTDLGSSSVNVISFCLFMLFTGFSRQGCWSGLLFPSPVDHVLSELPTMNHPSWVGLHSMAHSFTDLEKAVIHVISLVSFLWLCISFYLLSDG